MNTIIPISYIDFKNYVNIKFNNILDGFNNYKNFTIEAKDIENGEEKIINFIEDIFINNNNECYIDFYLNNLSNVDLNNLRKLIPLEDTRFLNNFLSLNHDKPYYKVTDNKYLPFLTRLNTREIFFITFYFTHIPITIWGNYNMSFPCFFENDNTLNHYYNLAQSNLLNII